MTTDAFEYHGIYPYDPTVPVGLIAVRLYPGPAQAVLWDVPAARWSYAPEVALQVILNDEHPDRVRPVARAEAQRIALDLLGSRLPPESELLSMCMAGARQTTR